MSVLRRFVAFAALVVLVAAGRARLLDADDMRSGRGAGDVQGSPPSNRPDTRM